MTSFFCDIVGKERKYNMRYRKITALIFAAALGLAVLTACTEQSDNKEAAPTVAESSAVRSEPEEDCCREEESCCTQDEKSDCCKDKETSEKNSNAEKSCCHKESDDLSVPDCCSKEEISDIADCCGG